MICPKCGSSKIKRSARRGVAEGLFLRLACRAPFRCESCGRRFVDSLAGHNFRRKGGRGGIAGFLGLRRGQRKKLRLTLYSLVVILVLIALAQLLFRLIPTQRPQDGRPDPRGVLYKRK